MNLGILQDEENIDTIVQVIHILAILTYCDELMKVIVCIIALYNKKILEKLYPY